MDYIILSVMILCLGVVGLVTRHDLIKMLIAIEMINAAATMNFVVFGSLMGNSLGQAFSILALLHNIPILKSKSLFFAGFILPSV